MSADEKVVQTKLTTEEYERLRRVADNEGRSLKDVLRDAATEYTRTHSEFDPDDPFFNYEPDGTTGDSLSAKRADDYLYGDE